MLLELTRPLVIFDVETTGLDYRVDKIIQIGLVKIYPDGTINEWETLVNPQMAISEDAAATHGITDEMVTESPVFSRIAPVLKKGLDGCDVGGYNVDFDLRFVVEEFRRLAEPSPVWESIVDVFQIFKRFERRDLSSAVRFYLGEELEGAHNALADVRATLRVLEAQLERYPTLPRTPDLLQTVLERPLDDRYLDNEGKIAWKDGVAIINFGTAQRGVPLQNVPRGFFEWMLRGNFSKKVKEIVRDALNGQYPVKE